MICRFTKRRGGSRAAPTSSWISTIFLLASVASAQSPEPKPISFLVLKTGEAFATQEKAGAYLKAFADVLGARTGGMIFDIRIHNDPASAAAWCGAAMPAAGIVTPAFYLEHRKALDLRPILFTRRHGEPSERYALLVRKGSGLRPEGLAGKPVATTVAAEAGYVRHVVFPAQRLDLKSEKNLADAVLAITEKDTDAPAAVLADRATRKFFEEDPLSWPELEVAGESDPLPPDLVVVFGKNAPEGFEAKLKDAMLGITKDEAGRKACAAIQTEGFGMIDAELMKRAEERWDKGLVPSSKFQVPSGK